MKPFRVHRRARREISDIYLHYQNTDDQTLAPDFRLKLRAAFREISQNPARYPCQHKTQVRRYLLARFPYQIHYIDHREYIHILAIAHTSRRPGYWKSRMTVA